MSNVGNVYYVDGDTGPDLLCTFTGQDLTGYTITLHVKKQGGEKFSIAATAVDLSAGSFKFVWSAGQLVEGAHEMEIEFIASGGSPRYTVPSNGTIGLIVRNDLGSAA